LRHITISDRGHTFQISSTLFALFLYTELLDFLL